MHIDHLVQAEKLELLYRQSYPAIFASYLSAIILAYILWPVQQKSTLIIYLSLQHSCCHRLYGDLVPYSSCQLIQNCTRQ